MSQGIVKWKARCAWARGGRGVGGDDGGRRNVHGRIRDPTSPTPRMTVVVRAKKKLKRIWNLAQYNHVGEIGFGQFFCPLAFLSAKWKCHRPSALAPLSGRCGWVPCAPLWSLLESASTTSLRSLLGRSSLRNRMALRGRTFYCRDGSASRLDHLTGSGRELECERVVSSSSSWELAHLYSQTAHHPSLGGSRSTRRLPIREASEVRTLQPEVPADSATRGAYRFVVATTFSILKT
jgi:hypothetical protein